MTTANDDAEVQRVCERYMATWMTRREACEDWETGRKYAQTGVCDV
jgi:hypothetical protein